MLKFKNYPILKWSLSIISLLIVFLIAFGFWFISLIPAGPNQAILSQTQAKDLPYIINNNQTKHGKILAVLTSCETMGNSGKSTGYELTELSRAYYVFQANGFDVDIASPKGGNPPVVIDDDDMAEFDFAFLNDRTAQEKVKNSIPIAKVDPDLYDAIYFAGGKGTMFDFPDNANIQEILRNYYESGKVIGAVCHGPAALVNVRLSDGSMLVDKKKVCSFTNQEELFLLSDAKEIFPFLLQDQLTASGGIFIEGDQYLNNVTVDGNLITGQNPWSTWTLAETMIEKLGYIPVKREITEEEIAIDVLLTYETKGYRKAKELVNDIVKKQEKTVSRNLLGIHSIIAIMKLDLRKCFDLIRLLKYTSDISEKK